MKRELLSLPYEELKQYFEECSLPNYRVDQVYTWLHQKLVPSIGEMKNISKTLQTKLEQEFEHILPKEMECLSSKQDGTKKYLFALQDGNVVESVWMPYQYGNSVCISSQVGCKMGCTFCASTIDGFVRNLNTSEMLGQVYQMQNTEKQRVFRVVVMGSGEPLDNYENLISFIRMLSSEKGLHISQRNITISTCGLPKQIKRLAEEKLALTLALSLHASSDEKRKSIMPIASQYSLRETLEACDYYFEKTGRRVTYEYALIRGINDKKEDAMALVTLLKKKNCHVNLIPMNPVKERDYKKSLDLEVQNFKNILEKNRFHVTIRREMGSDIDAACGQLRNQYKERKRAEGGELSS